MYGCKTDITSHFVDRLTNDLDAFISLTDVPLISWV
jgi:hypothetical protein